jgi:hypothetical protein
MNADFQTQMEKIWLVLAEIVGKPDRSPESRIGFMNITTWADSKEEASSKIEGYLSSLGWNLVEVDTAGLVDEDSQYGDEVADMIDRTRNNRNAIILGTFHTYKAN